jgi:hypothetical protein
MILKKMFDVLNFEYEWIYTNGTYETRKDDQNFKKYLKKSYRRVSKYDDKGSVPNEY